VRGRRGCRRSKGNGWRGGGREKGKKKKKKQLPIAEGKGNGLFLKRAQVSRGTGKRGRREGKKRGGAKVKREKKEKWKKKYPQTIKNPPEPAQGVNGKCEGKKGEKKEGPAHTEGGKRKEKLKIKPLNL